MSDILPPNNLLPDSMPWGRRLENSLLASARAVGITGDSSQSNNRSIASSFGQISRNIDAIEERVNELRNRRVEYFTHPGVFVNVNTTLNVLTTFSASASVTPPPPLDGEFRVAVVSVSLEGYNSNSSAGTAVIQARVSGGGMTGAIQPLPFPVPSQTNLPMGWKSRYYGSSSAITDGLSIDVSMDGDIYGNGSYNVDLGIADLQFAVIYGQKA